jgi:cytoskeletal protein CcmA (bactofilin family)
MRKEINSFKIFKHLWEDMATKQTETVVNGRLSLVFDDDATVTVRKGHTLKENTVIDKLRVEGNVFDTVRISGNGHTLTVHNLFLRKDLVVNGDLIIAGKVSGERMRTLTVRNLILEEDTEIYANLKVEKIMNNGHKLVVYGNARTETELLNNNSILNFDRRVPLEILRKDHVLKKDTLLDRTLVVKGNIFDTVHIFENGHILTAQNIITEKDTIVDGELRLCGTVLEKAGMLAVRKLILKNSIVIFGDLYTDEVVTNGYNIEVRGKTTRPFLKYWEKLRK